MILFLACALLLAVTVAAALVFAVRRGSVQVVDRGRVNVAIYRERLAELDAERVAGRLDDAQHAALLGELQRMLVDDVAPDADVPAASRSGRMLSVVLLLLVPALSLGIYLADGFDAPVREWLALSVRAPEARTMLAPQAEGTALAVTDISLADAARLTQSLLGRRPADAEAWYRLGQTWIDLDAPALAVESLRTARRLAPHNTEIATRLVDLELALADGRLTDEVRAALDAVLAVDPAHQGVLMVYGMVAFNNGEFALASTRWRQLQSTLDPASEGAQLLGRSIALAEQRAATAARGTLPVHVAWSPALGAVPDGATLFVIVRAAGGPPMPVAVRRLPSSLPVDIVMGDADQMVPGAPLAERGPLEVLARLSRSGAPTASAGDVESAPVALRFPLDAPVTLTLDRRLP